MSAHTVRFEESLRADMDAALQADPSADIMITVGHDLFRAIRREGIRQVGHDGYMVLGCHIDMDKSLSGLEYRLTANPHKCKVYVREDSEIDGKCPKCGKLEEHYHRFENGACRCGLSEADWKTERDRQHVERIATEQTHEDAIHEIISKRATVGITTEKLREGMRHCAALPLQRGQELGDALMIAYINDNETEAAWEQVEKYYS